MKELSSFEENCRRIDAWGRALKAAAIKGEPSPELCLLPFDISEGDLLQKPEDRL
jgi:hypothetical protein